MILSKHFKLEEFTKSMTATRKGIDNTPGAGDIKNLENTQGLLNNLWKFFCFSSKALMLQQQD